MDSQQDQHSDRQETTPLVRCEHCRQEIENPRKDQRFCNSKCRWQAWNEKHPRMVRWGHEK